MKVGVVIRARPHSTRAREVALALDLPSVVVVANGDPVGSMLEAATRKGFDVIVDASDAMDLTRTAPEARRMLRAHLAAGVDYSESLGFDFNTMPRIINRAALDRFCVSCHNARLRTAGLQLDTVDIDHPAGDAALWEKVLHKLRTREMPPAGLPRPDAATYDALAGHLETMLDRAAEAAPNPGRPAVYRLSRFQYANAIRDLIALDIDVASLLPADDSGYGFDNIGDVLTVSPMLVERYLSAAGKMALENDRLAEAEALLSRALDSAPDDLADERGRVDHQPHEEGQELR